MSAVLCSRGFASAVVLAGDSGRLDSSASTGGAVGCQGSMVSLHGEGLARGSTSCSVDG
jgi:hypothetical protein